MSTQINHFSLDFTGNTTRELIIKVLSIEWPLSTKEITSRVQKISSKSLTYQAIHKTITQLVNNGIILKSPNKKLQLNMEWIINIEKFGTTLHTNYTDKQKVDLKELYKETQVNLIFENPLELGVFLCNTFFIILTQRIKPLLCTSLTITH